MLDIEVKMTVLSPVPTARCRMCAGENPWATNMNERIGTMLTPPPIPNSPASTPMTAPSRT